jgi:hypothetical protein
MKKVLIFLGVTVFLNIILRIISRLSTDFSEWYAVNIYPLLVGVFGRVNGFFPFAIVEALLYLLIAAAIAGIVLLIIKLIKGKQKRRKTLACAGLAVSCTVSALLLMFLFGGEINYQRKPFSEHSGLETGMYDSEILREVIIEVIGELERLVPLIETCADGGFLLDRSSFNATARIAMRSLGELYPVLDTYYPAPKPVLFSRQILSPLFIGGVFSPFTLEALYNRDMPDSGIPFTALHELSHLSGFMREDEANFIAFLACRGSEDIAFQYSGYDLALWSLFRVYDGEDLYELYMSIPEQVRLQAYIDSQYWHSVRSRPGGAAVAAMASAVNDTYLKAQGQEDGVRSYGRVVDLLIADYLARSRESAELNAAP